MFDCLLIRWFFSCIAVLFMLFVVCGCIGWFDLLLCFCGLSVGFSGDFCGLFVGYLVVYCVDCCALLLVCRVCLLCWICWWLFWVFC